MKYGDMPLTPYWSKPHLAFTYYLPRPEDLFADYRYWNVYECRNSGSFPWRNVVSPISLNIFLLWMEIEVNLLLYIKTFQCTLMEYHKTWVCLNGIRIQQSKLLGQFTKKDIRRFAMEQQYNCLSLQSCL